MAEEEGFGACPSGTAALVPTASSQQAVSTKGFDPLAEEVWSEHLTDAQLKMVIASGQDRDGSGFGVDLRGANWRTARALVKHGLGWIEGGAPSGSELPGLYFNNAEGVRVLNEFADDLPNDDFDAEYDAAFERICTNLREV